MTIYPSLMTLNPVREAVSQLLNEGKKTLTYKLWNGCGVHHVYVSINMEDVPSCSIVKRNFETGGVSALNWDNSGVEARSKENLIIHMAMWIVNTINQAAIGTGFGAGQISEIVEELI